uniref:Uncharacterized protein n=1 Tax=Glossina pallidipes TaxID=7398 RepID=A0A1A9ZL75_GLOPL
MQSDDYAQINKSIYNRPLLIDPDCNKRIKISSLTIFSHNNIFSVPPPTLPKKNELTNQDVISLRRRLTSAAINNGAHFIQSTINNLSLGFPLASLVPINRTTAELRYLLGTACFENKAKQLSSSILFSCDMKSGRTYEYTMAYCSFVLILSLHSPQKDIYEYLTAHCCEKATIAKKLQQLVIKFWPTNVICPPHMCIFNENTCEITNEEINVSYNLKKAPFANNGKITISKDKTAFILNLCDSHHKAVTDYSQSLVNLFFTSKGPCGGDVIHLLSHHHHHHHHRHHHIITIYDPLIDLIYYRCCMG